MCVCARFKSIKFSPKYLIKNNFTNIYVLSRNIRSKSNELLIYMPHLSISNFSGKFRLFHIWISQINSKYTIHILNDTIKNGILFAFFWHISSIRHDSRWNGNTGVINRMPFHMDLREKKSAETPYGFNGFCFSSGFLSFFVMLCYKNTHHCWSRIFTKILYFRAISFDFAKY